MNLNWTEEDRKAWEKTWKEPHMQLGLLLLKLSVRPDAVSQLPPGIDVRETASQSYAYLQGMEAMLGEIDRLNPKITAKPLPQPFLTKRPPAEPE